MRKLVAVALFAAVVAGCGGDDASSPAAPVTAPGATSGGGNSPTTSSAAPLPTSRFKQEFTETRSKVRFFNAYTYQGKATAVDVYWGNVASGEKFTTIKPNTMSEPFAVKLPKESRDGAGIITIMPTGETETNRVAQQITGDAWTDGEERIYAIGGQRPVSGASSYGGTTTAVFVKGGKVKPVPDPAAGKVAFYTINAGISHLQPKDFVVPGVTGKCFSSVAGGGGNAGTPYETEPGTIEVALFDANSSCKAPLGAPTKVTAAAGERYVLFGFGETVETRQALAVKL